MKRILVTGGAGFIGSHFVKKLCTYSSDFEQAGTQIVVYDKLTYAGDLKRLEGVPHIFVHGDICDGELLNAVLRKYGVTHVVHFAAESHVDRSIADQAPFMRTNVLGTEVLIETVDRFWRETGGYEHRQFIHISTDEVYGSILQSEKPASETTPLNPMNPYAVSKAKADALVQHKIKRDHFPALILRSSNNYGLNQNAEKFIPRIINCLVNNHPIPVYGKGAQMRCWLSVEDYAEIICELIRLELIGEIFNVVGEETYSNIDMVMKIIEIFGQSVSRPIERQPEITFVPDRAQHDFYYHVDGSKLKRLISERYFKRRLENYFMELFLTASV